LIINVRTRFAALPFVLFYATSCARANAAESPNPAQAAPTVAAAAPATDTPAMPAPGSAPTIDTARIRALSDATAPNEPVQITFTWSLQDRDFKFSGRGIVRMQGPYHARLDLFGFQDLLVARTALIDDSLSIVYSGPKVPLPPPAFMWATVGVFKAPVAQSPSSFNTDGTGFSFGYDPAPAHWRFRADATTLRSAEWQGDDGGRRTVELSGPFRMGRPSKAVYRDWREFRELTLVLTAVEKVDSFAPEIWDVSK
jgi:hypothetical protein